METPVNTGGNIPKATPNRGETFDQKIMKMQLTFDNALLPEIFEPMKTVGYTVEKIESMQNDLAALIVLQQSQIKEYADATHEQASFDANRAAIEATFSKNRSLARVLFKNNVQAQSALRLSGDKPTAYAPWYQMVANFYAQLTAIPDLAAKVATIGLTAEVIASETAALASLQAQKETLSKENSEAQAATDARDVAFDALYPLYSEYVQYAKLLLPDNQVLESIGVKVRRV